MSGEASDTASSLLADCKSLVAAFVRWLLHVPTHTHMRHSDTSNLVSCSVRVLKKVEEMETIAVCTLDS